MDNNCNSDLFANQINCPTLKTQTIDKSNQCTKKVSVHEDLDSWMSELPGGMKVV